MSSELIQVPPVLLTQQLFTRAQAEGIQDIVPDEPQMAAIGQLTATRGAYLPDITVLRDHGKTRREWDVNFKNTPDDYRYFPASELQVAERGLQVVSAGGLRRHIAESGKRLVQLTVSDWDALGEKLTESIEEHKTSKKGPVRKYLDLATNAMGWWQSTRSGDPDLDSPSRSRIRDGRDLQPYTVIR